MNYSNSGHNTAGENNEPVSVSKRWLGNRTRRQNMSHKEITEMCVVHSAGIERNQHIIKKKSKYRNFYLTEKY
ncbi:hypothetical protein Y032_0008g325 [Ancylostoma ceylanicum]|uniref:Uncharacterized protein n=1 Tax=Ancylostoma ceylanicum TaxID=53326 RepID=A0A016VKH7_9BILA|nr:hypothetical protein Y032_0008g325 [Ancylostoma ceylanicum]